MAWSLAFAGTPARETEAEGPAVDLGRGIVPGRQWFRGRDGLVRVGLELVHGLLVLARALALEREVVGVERALHGHDGDHGGSGVCGGPVELGHRAQSAFVVHPVILGCASVERPPR
jgi:hypothetical protein